MQCCPHIIDFPSHICNFACIPEQSRPAMSFTMRPQHPPRVALPLSARQEQPVTPPTYYAPGRVVPLLLQQRQHLL
ncbi:hypothetical protein Y032_0095g2863 [Ancylostoma ceylanicum]|uniref:Uncharacterized protein n=1 Tax=Ancylostoma ceylanicum TaxID=53326 RepID=A0A016TL41_9BILA|nr:hypothetical protein Y032_0095g2863 [Ancylostoma ceylanicum]